MFIITVLLFGKLRQALAMRILMFSIADSG